MASATQALTDEARPALTSASAIRARSSSRLMVIRRIPVDYSCMHVRATTAAGAALSPRTAGAVREQTGLSPVEPRMKTSRVAPSLAALALALSCNGGPQRVGGDATGGSGGGNTGGASGPPPSTGGK